MIIKTINVRAVQIYVEKDKDGYLSLSTDGYLPGGALDAIIKVLREAQDEDDREADEYTAQRDLERRMAFRY
jgi:hypothetical protein